MGGSEVKEISGFILNPQFLDFRSRLHPSDLGLVPVLSLCDVLGGDALVLRSDVSQCRRQVRLGHVHLDLDLRLLHLGLQLTDLLQEEKEAEKVMLIGVYVCARMCDSFPLKPFSIS